MIINGKYYESVKVGSPEYKALIKKWADEAFKEEVQRDYEEYAERKENK